MPATNTTEFLPMNRLARAAALTMACAVFWISQPSAGTTVMGQAPEGAEDQTVGNAILPAPSVLAAPEVATELVSPSLPAAVPVEAVNEEVVAEAATDVHPAESAQPEVEESRPVPVPEPKVVPTVKLPPQTPPQLPLPTPPQLSPQLPAPVAQPWQVHITPAPPRPTLLIQGRSYNQVYESIPYRQAEYLANPGYRHDATMEILFGQMRPTTVVKQNTPQIIQNPRPGLTQPYLATPSDYYSYPWSGYMFPNAFFPYFGLPGMTAPPMTY